MFQSAFRRALLLALIVSFLPAELHAQWKPAPGKLMTQWAKDVSPEKVLPEYPRPQMVRDAWANLNGLWDYAITDKDVTKPDKWDGQILVPFAIESALSGVGKRVGPDKRLWYRRTFTVPTDAAWKDKRVLLHFGAVDWDAAVYVNGNEVAKHKGGYDPFSADITDALAKPGTPFAPIASSGPQRHELVVSVYDPTNASFQPVGKQHNNPHGIWYTPVTGIWQTVWMEPVPQVFIERLQIEPNLDQGIATIIVRTNREMPTGSRLNLDVTLAGEKVTAVDSGPRFQASKSHTLTVAFRDLPHKMRLWSPDDPALYDATITLELEKETEKLNTYFAMRKIEIGKDDRGVIRMMLNDKPLFQFGPLDQGWWPDGLYTAPTDAALKYDIEITKKLGFNMIRKHVKTEPARWYHHCDRAGMLVWQDMPNGDKHAKWDPVGTHDRTEATRSKESSDNHDREWKNIIDALSNHPCIVVWVPFNEGWGQADTVRVTEWTMRYDRTRLVNCASGGNDFPVGHIYDIHRYPGPAAPKPDGKRAIVLGEYGGLGLPVEGHTWLEKGNWGYRSFTNANELTAAYIDLVTRLRPLIHEPGLAAAIYTQTTDVEIEVNGFLTYDRAVMKMDLEKVSAANRKVYLPPPVIKKLVATAEEDAVAWRYTTAKPADGWEKAGFDDSKWTLGNAGFGEPSTPGSVVRTLWKTNDIWLRRTVEVAKDAKLDDAHIVIHYDEDTDVYFDGELAASVKGYTTGYTIIAIADKAKAALKDGKAEIAVHTKQTGGGQYIDLGIVTVTEQK